MKKMIQLVVLLLAVVFPVGVKALSVDKNNLTIEKGANETVALYANVNAEITEVQFTLVYTTYDVPASFIIESGLTDTNPNGISHKIIFSNPVSGKVKLGSIRVNVVNNPKENVGTINIHSGRALTTNNNTINLNAQTINVKIGQPKPADNPEPKDNEEPPKKTNLLEKIESSIVKINLKQDVYEYTVDIEENIEELDLKPIAKDEKYKVETSTQKIADLEDGKITITVKEGENTEKYTVKVNVKKDEEENNKTESQNTKTTYKYKGKWITLIVILAGVLFVGLLMTKKR